MHTLDRGYGIGLFTPARFVAVLVAVLWACAAHSAGDRIVSVGQRLFFDKRLSESGSISCGSCHEPSLHFADGKKMAQGLHGRVGTRNTPSITDIGLYTSLFWDGRVQSPQEQLFFPLLNPIEHGLKSMDEILRIVRADPQYAAEFKYAFGGMPDVVSPDNFAKALVAYELSLGGKQSQFDRYLARKELGVLSTEAVRGAEIFRGKAGCASCHLIDGARPPFTDNKFHAGITQSYDLSEGLKNLTLKIVKMNERTRDQAISTDPKVAALGRFVVTLDAKDIGCFRTPTLRNVAVTAPYMHDGSIATLEEAVDWELYARGDQGKAIVLMPHEKGWLLAFLRSLTAD